MPEDFCDVQTVAGYWENNRNLKCRFPCNRIAAKIMVLSICRKKHIDKIPTFASENSILSDILY
jgi:hypothetical protein